MATFSDIFAKESTQDVFLVIDEAQLLYAYPNSQLWADIKSCQQPSSRVRILLLAPYSLENIVRSLFFVLVSHINVLLTP